MWRLGCLFNRLSEIMFLFIFNWHISETYSHWLAMKTQLQLGSGVITYDEFVFTLSYSFCLVQVSRACATCLKGMGCARSLREVLASRTVAFSLPRGSLTSGRLPRQALIRTRGAPPLGWPGSLCSLRYASIWYKYIFYTFICHSLLWTLIWK